MTTLEIPAEVQVAAAAALQKDGKWLIPSPSMLRVLKQLHSDEVPSLLRKQHDGAYFPAVTLRSLALRGWVRQDKLGWSVTEEGTAVFFRYQEKANDSR